MGVEFTVHCRRLWSTLCSSSVLSVRKSATAQQAKWQSLTDYGEQSTPATVSLCLNESSTAVSVEEIIFHNWQRI